VVWLVPHGDGGFGEGPFIAIADRKKDVIITGGENVSSIEVEDCLSPASAVAGSGRDRCIVPDEKWGETIQGPWSSCAPGRRRPRRISSSIAGVA
jgi:acyl-coenzyme A synthetase/AMP-(fatty) acid ligase